MNSKSEDPASTDVNVINVYERGPKKGGPFDDIQASHYRPLQHQRAFNCAIDVRQVNHANAL